MVGHQIQRLGRSASPLIGDRYAELLAAHRVVVRAALSRHAGVEVDTQGDAFFAAFREAGAAAAASTEIRDGLGDGPVRVRIGIYTGEPLVTDESHVGLEVHRAARIAAAALVALVARFDPSRELLRSRQDHRVRLLVILELAQGLVADSPSGWPSRQLAEVHRLPEP